MLEQCFWKPEKRDKVWVETTASKWPCPVGSWAHSCTEFTANELFMPLIKETNQS